MTCSSLCGLNRVQNYNKLSKPPNFTYPKELIMNKSDFAGTAADKHRQTARHATTDVNQTCVSAYTLIYDNARKKAVATIFPAAAHVWSKNPRAILSAWHLSICTLLHVHCAMKRLGKRLRNDRKAAVSGWKYGYLAACLRPFSVQKAMFQKAKGRILQRKGQPSAAIMTTIRHKRDNGRLSGILFRQETQTNPF